MSIVERLRAWDDEHDDRTGDVQLYIDAADVIEHLIAAYNTAAKEAAYQAVRAQNLTAERDRLRAALKRITGIDAVLAEGTKE